MPNMQPSCLRLVPTQCYCIFSDSEAILQGTSHSAISEPRTLAFMILIRNADQVATVFAELQKVGLGCTVKSLQELRVFSFPSVITMTATRHIRSDQL